MNDFLFHENYFLNKIDSIFEISDKINEQNLNHYKDYNIPLIDYEVAGNENMINSLSDINYSKNYSKIREVSMPELHEYINYEGLYNLQDFYEWLLPLGIILTLLTIFSLFIYKKASLFFGFFTLIGFIVIGKYYFYEEKKIIDELTSSVDWNRYKESSKSSAILKRYDQLYVPEENYVSSNSKTYKIRAKNINGYDYYEGEIILINDDIESAFIINDGNKIELDLDWSGNGEFRGSDNSNNEYYAEFD